MVFAPSPRDHLLGLLLEAEPGFALRRVRGQLVLEATERLALVQRLPERPAKPVIAAWIDEVLHHAEGSTANTSVAAVKRGLGMAAKNASVSDVQEVPPDTLGHALASGSVPKGRVAHLTHLLDEAPVPLVVMAVEEAAAKEGVAPKAVWRSVAKLAQSLAAHRLGFWA